MLNMISFISKISDLNKYATKTLKNDCFVHLDVGKLWLSYLLSAISEKCLRPMYFFIKIKIMSRMSRMQIAKQMVAITWLIFGNYF